MVNPMIACIEIISHDDEYFKVNITMTNSEKYNMVLLSGLQLNRLIDTHCPEIIDSSIFSMNGIKNAISNCK
jgi:hypothetical protein